MNTKLEEITGKKELMTPGDIDHDFDYFYKTFILLMSLEKAKDEGNHKLTNLILQARNFELVIECDNSMHGGDIGRFINIWRQWLVMAQGVKGLNKYGIHLP